jgi:hypothetical protein
MEVVAQVSTVVAVLLVIPAVGAVVFSVILIALFAVQPLLPVTVTVYVAALPTGNVALIPTTLVPSLHE